MKEFLLAVGVAVAFVAWPMIAKPSGLGGVWVGIVVLVGSIIGNVLAGGITMAASPLFTAKQFLIVLAAGVVNGAALYYYGVATADHRINTGTFVTLVVVTMAVLGTMIGWATAKSFPPLDKIAWLVVLAVAMYKLQRV